MEHEKKPFDTTYNLDPNSIQDFQSKGHVLLRNVANKDELKDYAQEIEKMTDEFAKEHFIPLEQRGTYGKAFVQNENLWTSSKKVAEFTMGRRFAKIAAQLMNVDGVRLYHDQALFKEPGGGPTPLHQDQQYWPLDAKTCTMWMPLSDTKATQGTMHFASKSHKLGYLGPMSISDESEQVFSRLVKEKEFPVEYSGDMSQGDATFHTGWTIHGAVGNDGEMRSAMTIIFIEDHVKILEPDSPARSSDLNRWFPGLKPGDVAASPLNPLLYHQSWEYPFKLIATDLDGTLVRPDGSISDKTVAALDRIRNYAKLVLVTGRPTRWLGPVLDRLIHDHEGAVVIASNGAVIYDCLEKTIVAAHLLTPEILRQVAELVNGLIPGGATYACERLNGFKREFDYQPRQLSEGVKDPQDCPMSLDELFTEPCVKLLIRPKENWTSDELVKFVGPKLNGLVQVTHATPIGHGLLELSKLGTTKAHTLAEYAASLGIDSKDVLAFGDQPNDVEMLTWAGCGVAMGDGHSLTKQAANTVTWSCDEDGVARFLEELY